MGLGIGRALGAGLLLAAALPASARGEPARKTPYWASIAAGAAMMRTGPGKNYPAVWLYKRADLPIRVVKVYPSWRKVEDPSGTTGWMLVNLLSGIRTAIVTGGEARPLRDKPEDAAKVLFRAEPGVVGRISDCIGAWCKFDANGRAGYIRTDYIWGTDPGETVP